MIFKWLNSLRVKAGFGKQPVQREAYRTQWAKDYQLVPWGSEALFGEYLEMGKSYDSIYFILDTNFQIMLHFD